MKRVTEYQGQVPHGGNVSSLEIEDDDYCRGCEKICNAYSEAYGEIEEGYCECNDGCRNCEKADERYQREMDERLYGPPDQGDL
jgi:hypothetical protein